MGLPPFPSLPLFVPSPSFPFFSSSGGYPEIPSGLAGPTESDTRASGQKLPSPPDVDPLHTTTTSTSLVLSGSGVPGPDAGVGTPAAVAADAGEGPSLPSPVLPPIYLQILAMRLTDLTLGQVPEMKDCPGKSRTDGHLIHDHLYSRYQCSLSKI